MARYLVGSVGARTGDEASGPALLLLALGLTGSAVTGSAVLAGLTVTTGIGGPVFGVLLDRARRPGRLLAAALIGYAAGLLVLTGVLVTGLPLGVAVLVAAVTGLFGPALNSGWTAQLPALVSRLGRAPVSRAGNGPAGNGRTRSERTAGGPPPAGGRPLDLGRAYALDATSYTVASLAGPALVGVVATVAGGWWAVLVTAVLLGCAVPLAAGLPHPDQPSLDNPSPGVGGRGGAVREVVGELVVGVRVVLRAGALRRVTLGSGVSHLGMGVFVAVVPLLGERLVGRAGLGAVLLAVVAVGGVVTTGLLARRGGRETSRLSGGRGTGRPGGRVVGDWLVVVGTVGMGVGLAGCAVAWAVPVAVVGAFVVGLGDGPQLAGLLAVRHREAPAGLRGQVFGTAVSVKLTAFAVGAAAAGPLAAVSVRGALAVAATAQLAAVPVMWPRRRTGEEGRVSMLVDVGNGG